MQETAKSTQSINFINNVISKNNYDVLRWDNVGFSSSEFLAVVLEKRLFDGLQDTLTLLRIGETKDLKQKGM